MKKILLLLCLISVLTVSVSAMEYTAPTVPEIAKPYMPEKEESFSHGLFYIIKSSIAEFRPELESAMKISISLCITVFILSILNTLSKDNARAIPLVGSVVVGILLMEPIDSFIRLGISTVENISNYGQLLLPVMTSVLAAQGGTSSSVAIYAGTVFFDSVLTMLINKIVVPAVYIFLCFSIAECAVGQEILQKLRDFAKWIITWSMKTVLYIFSAYISVSGVIAGSVDAAAIKATKLAISGMVPIVGGALSDASETILVSASILKNSVGIYGVYALLALFINPCLKIGVQYLLLKFSSTVCNIYGSKPVVTLIQNLSSGMGMILAMTSIVCLLQLISLVCFMKGIG